MFATRKEYIELIKNLQNSIFPKLKKCWGYNPWFIIQIQIGFYFHHILNGWIKLGEKQPFYKSLFKGRITFSEFKRFLKAIYYLLYNYKKWRNKWNNTVALFGYRGHDIMKTEESYNVYLKPYQAVLNKQGIKNVIVYFDDKEDIQELYAPLYNFHYFLYKIKLKIFTKQVNNTKYNSKLICDFFKSSKFEIENVALNITNTVIETEFYYRIYCSLLKILSPQKIWIYCYYDINGAGALIRAANRLKIDSIEYQHSAISDSHFAYTKWDFIDEYREFFPKSFFVWSDLEKELICRNFSGETYTPQINVSGNFYLEQEKRNNNKKRTNDVLVCLQGQWIPKFVEDAITNSDSVKWYFRLHPRYPRDKEKLLSFVSLYPDKVEIEKANNLPLYELFKNASSLLTVFSGVALEAKEFGLQIIIVGEEGYVSYENHIKEGIFKYAENEGQLLDLIK